MTIFLGLQCAALWLFASINASIAAALVAGGLTILNAIIIWYLNERSRREDRETARQVAAAKQSQPNA